MEWLELGDDQVYIWSGIILSQRTATTRRRAVVKGAKYPIRELSYRKTGWVSFTYSSELAYYQKHGPIFGLI